MSYSPLATHSPVAIYIAGPEVLYLGGDLELGWMRKLAEARGFTVTLPNDDPLALGNADRRKDADAIFDNCALQMNRSDVIICDLDQYRGTEPDGGSIYEIGMAYGRDMRIICFTRDKRPVAVKDPNIVLRDGQAYDREGRLVPYADLPFAASVVASSKIIEGDFDDALRQLQLDLEEDSKRQAKCGTAKPNQVSPEPARDLGDRPRVYFASPDRFRDDAAAYYEWVRELCAPFGWDVITPIDDAPGVPRLTEGNPWTLAANTFAHWESHVRDCDVVIADLNDYHGWEPNSDTSFECGLGFQLGKRLFGYMDSTDRMIDRVPNLGADAQYADLAGAKAENFDYPINLMFASSMPVLQGDLESVLPTIAAQLRTK